MKHPNSNNHDYDFDMIYLKKNDQWPKHKQCM